MATGGTGADLAEDHQRGGHVDAVDAREVHASHLERPYAQVELRRIPDVAASLALVGLDGGDVQPLQLRLDLLVALLKRLGAEVECIECLTQREQVFGAQVPRRLRAISSSVARTRQFFRPASTHWPSAAKQHTLARSARRERRRHGLLPRMDAVT